MLYRELLAEDPEMSDVWLQLAQVLLRQGMTADAVARVSRSDQAQSQGRRKPARRRRRSASSGSNRRGRETCELAVSVAPAGAHELLAKIALARHDRQAALREAKLAQDADPTLPMPLYVEGLLLYNEGHYAEALAVLLRARTALEGRTVQMNDLNYYIGDSLARLERYARGRAVPARGDPGLPATTRARAPAWPCSIARWAATPNPSGPSTICCASSPTPEGRALAAQLWTMFGEPEKAQRVKIPLTMRALGSLACVPAFTAVGRTAPQHPRSSGRASTSSASTSA